jgi:hypothetical protein
MARIARVRRNLGVFNRLLALGVSALRGAHLMAQAKYFD